MFLYVIERAFSVQLLLHAPKIRLARYHSQAFFKLNEFLSRRRREKALELFFTQALSSNPVEKYSEKAIKLKFLSHESVAS